MTITNNIEGTTMEQVSSPNKITPILWFDKEASEGAQHCTRTLNNSKTIGLLSIQLLNVKYIVDKIVRDI